MKSSYAGNSAFPDEHLVATLEGKRELIQQFGKEIEIDEGIVVILDAINSVSLFLTESSCQGSDGDSSSEHFDDAYVAIGALYGQYQLLEQFARIIKKVFRERISCSLNGSVQTTLPYEEYEHVPVFRKYLRIDFYDKEVFPEFKKALEKFSQNLPSEAELETQFKEAIANEVKDYGHWNERLSLVLSNLTSRTLLVEKTAIEETLRTHRFNNIEVRDEPERSGYPAAVKISFTFSQERNVEHLFRPLAFVFGTDIKLFNPLLMDQHKNFKKEINIYLFRTDLLNQLHTILKLWCESSNGKLI